MLNKKVGLRRILKLADYVRTVRPKKFDFRTIVGEFWRGKQDLSCGATACALGHAATMPLFRGLGLYITEGGHIALKCEEGIDITEWDDICGPLFGISPQAMQALFQPDMWEEDSLYREKLYGDYPALGERATPAQWARHARRMVEILQEENQCVSAPVEARRKISII